MKKIVKYLVFIMVMEAVLVCFSGCSLDWLKKHKNNDVKDVFVMENGDKKYQKEFGTYIVSSDWMESKTHSTKGKYFYVKEGEDNEKKPNNISINEGTNRYSISEHEEFKNAIYAQLVGQASSSKATIVASGSTTEKGEMVYTFTLNSEKSIVKQYYIVGENKYIMIHETVWNKDDENAVDEVALKIVNSFEWKN